MHDHLGYLFLKYKQLCKLTNNQKDLGRQNAKLQPLVDDFHQAVVVCVPKLPRGQYVDVSGQDENCDAMYKAQC